MAGKAHSFTAEGKVLHPGERELKPAVVIKALNII